MMLSRAVTAEFPAIVALANRAYRGAGDEASWCSEAGIVEGDRLTEAQLKADLAAKPHAFLLTCRDQADGPLLGTVWLEPVADTDCASHQTWYLGLLTVTPDLQNRQLGRALLSEAEEFVLARGGTRMRMSVLNVRNTLIAWYQRRGYELTGASLPYPYEDDRFGRPMRDDLHFVILERVL